MFLDTQEITEAYKKLQEKKYIYAVALEISTSLDAQLETKKAQAILDGTIQGKNETERKAHMALVFASDLGDLDEKQAETRAARLAYELAEIEVKRIETLVRWLK